MSESSNTPSTTLDAELAARLAEREEKVAGLRASLSDRKRALLDKLVVSRAGAAARPQAIPRRADTGPAPLSFAQERLWFLDRLEPESPFYNLPTMLWLDGRLDVAALAGSLSAIVRRHHVLRTTFPMIAGEPRQVVGPVQPVPVPVVDLQAVGAVRRETEARRLAADESRRPFDLAVGPLLRTTVLRLAADRGLALFNLHHIVGDGWSSGVMMGELVTLYRAAVTGAESTLPEMAIQYADFADWQRRRLSGDALAAELAHWRSELDGAPDLLALPTDRPRPPVQSFRGGELRFTLPPPLTAALGALAEREGATLFMVLLAGFQALVGRWSGQDDLLVGSVVANRNRPEIEPLIGFFVNLLALRGRLAGAPTIRELVGRTKATALAAFAHQDLPFEKLIGELRLARSRGHNPLVQVVLALQNAPRGAFELPELTLRPLELPAATAKFDLGLLVTEDGGALHGQLQYATDLFDTATVARLAGQLERLLTGFVEQPERPLPEVSMLAAAERHQLEVEWGGTAGDWREADPVPAAFERQVRQRPDAVALEVADGARSRLTYGALDRRAARLAGRLRRLGVGPEVRVGLLAERSLDLAVAILAIWRAGGVFLPLDPGLPDARLAFLLVDALGGSGGGGAVVLAQEALRGRLAELPVGTLPVLFLDAEDGAGDEAPADPFATSRPGDLAYLIYTSGTTGRPKAVAVEHGSLSHTLRATAETFGFRAGDRMPCLAPFSFDIFFFELLAPLLAGGTAILFPLRPTLDVRALAAAVPDATALHAVPALMAEVVAAVAEENGTAPALRLAFVGGDAVPPELPAAMRRVFPAARVVVLYGPTETAILASSHEAAAGLARHPIGRPLPGVQLRIFGPDGTPQPIGVPGELWIGGRGVARGYLERPELTAEKFVPFPAGGRGGRWYRTGDLTRYRPDGGIEFLGRIDRQVKVRGFRIELGEVESVLLEQPGVRTAAVVAREQPGTGLPWLVAYVVAEPEAVPAVSALRSGLGARLPEYIVPARFVFLPELPLTSTGKVDRRALPEPGREEGEEGAAPQAARTPAEELLVDLWAKLLGIDRVGIHDNFFELGGHSLLATRLVAQLRGTFGVELPVRALFDAPTVAGLAALVVAEGGELPPPPLRPVWRVLREGRTELPASFAQERLWFLDRLAPGESVYNIPVAVRLTGRLDVPAFGAALSEVARRHETLRTGFQEGAGGQPVQRIDPWSPVALPVVDLTVLPRAAREGEVRRLVGEEAGRPFDLAAGRPWRTALLATGRAGKAEHVLLLNVHHIAADGWSMGVLVHELAALYGTVRAGRPAATALPGLPIQYGDFAVWQRSWLSGAALEAQIAWWRRMLAGAPTLELPTDRPRPAVRSSRGASRRMALPAGLAADLRQLARVHGATPFMVLLAGFEVLLGRLSGQDDVLVGTPIANRTHREVEGLIGFFVNTLVLRGDLSSDPAADFAAVLGRTREVTLDAYAHQDLPFEKLVEELAPVRDASRTPLFQVMFTLQETAPETGAFGDLAAEWLEGSVTTAKFDLSLVLVAGPGGGYVGAVDYGTDLFDAPTAARLAAQYETLLAGAAAAPEGRSLWELPLLSPAERAVLLVEWNDTRPAAGSPDRERPVVSVLQAIAEQASHATDAVAVAAPQGLLTYGELDRRSNRLAWRLRALGVGPEVPVAICAERSAALVVGLLAILKAGGAYVPLDPAHPPARLAVVLADLAKLTVMAGPPVVLVQESLRGRLPEAPAEGRSLISLDEIAAPFPAGGEREGAPPLPVMARHRAYVIYTSGSTGTPKGVEVEHGALANLLSFHRENFHTGPEDRYTQITNPSFDGLAWELWSSLAAGAALVVPDEATRAAPDRLLAWLAAEAITVSFQTTALAVALLAHAEAAGWPAGIALRALQTGGESLRRVPRGLPFELINLYGPTECTVLSTTARVVGGDIVPPIGRPIVNTHVVLLDRHGELVPLGMPGELLIGGDGVARGYLGRPGRTAESFVPDPFGDAPGARLYRTGDLARWRPDGQLEYLGRFDGQVKIRGFRIELGEIESALAAHGGVRDAAVIVWGGAETTRLVAYVAPREPGLTAADLQSFLRSRLPEFMLPASFVLLPALPLTPNGKVDRRALPEPEIARSADAEGRTAPRTPAEELLADLWAALLGTGAVGVHDNFFELGGHSLLATRLVSRVREVFGVELPVRALFDRPTVAELAALLAAGSGEELVAPPLRAVARDGDLPLSFAQERLWFLDRLEPGGSAYNIPAAVRLTGALDAAVFGAALDEVVRRHEALRTGFGEGEHGRPVQVILPWHPAGLPVVDLSALTADRREATARRLAAQEAGRPFDLTAGRPLRAGLLRLATAEHVLLLTVHHIAADGWSVGVLVGELAALYRAFRGGQASPLAELPVQYGDFAVWQRGWLSGEVLAAQTEFWRRALAGAPTLELPTDRPRPAVFSARGAHRGVVLPPGLSAALRRLARDRGATPFMTLLAGFEALLGRLAGQDDVLVGTPIANRTHRGVEGLIGFFVNTLVLRGDLAGEPGFEALLGGTREATLAAYAHQDLPFEKLVEELAPVRDASRTPLFQVMFTLDQQRAPVAGFGDLVAEPLEIEVATAKFDLTLSLGQGGEGGFAGTVEYATDLFDAATVVRLTHSLETLLRAVAADPGQGLSDLPLLTAAERHQLEVEWSAVPALAPRGETLVERLAVQAARTPDAVAVVAGEQRLTYGALAARAGQVGERLRRWGVGPGVRVGLALARSPELVASLFGVLAAGGTYVPLDPADPAERRDFLRRDANLRVVIDDAWLLALEGAGGAVSLGCGAGGAQLGDPLYVIYTSGSTGQPKGALVYQGAFAALVDWYVAELGLTAADRLLLLSSASFDLTQKNFFAPLLVGAELHLAPSLYDPVALRDLVERHGVTRINCTPSAFYPLVEQGDPYVLASLQSVVLGGEPIAAGRLAAWRRSAGAGAAVLNSYGPTECTDVVAFHRLAPAGGAATPPGGAATVPIGRPVPGVRLWIADFAGTAPLPIGVPGELWIGGACVGGGYLGDPARTALQFVPDPASEVPGARAYRTGDRARRLPDGTIESLGRIDRQVKVRGFRIEPGEVEAALAGEPGVREVAVVAREARPDRPGDLRLVAYVVPSEPVRQPGTASDPLVAELRASLARRLPAALVPSTFVVLAALPLTASGKIDRRALPEVGTAAGADAASYLAPRTPLEELVAGLWCELLTVEQVGVRDDFFALGGHSLLATQLAARLRAVAGAEVPLRRLFDAPTLEGMAAEVAAARAGAAGSDALEEPPLVPAPRNIQNVRLPLSFAQERLWFLERFDPGNPSLNIPLAVELIGRLSVPALGAAVAGLVERHESLRTTFDTVGGEPSQVIQPAGPVRSITLPEVELAALPEASARREAERLATEHAFRGFDIERGPLFRTCLLRLGAENHRFLLVVHHIVSDGWSMGVLIQDLGALYAALSQGLSPGLPPLPIQYADYALWQRRVLAAERRSDLDVWLEHLGGEIQPLELPTDRPRPAVQSYRGRSLRFALPADLASHLRAFGRQEGATLFMTLLAGAKALLSRHSGQDDLLLGTPIAGRRRLETEGLIGFFLNTLVLRTDLSGDPSLRTLVARVRDVTLDAFARQDVPFEAVLAGLKGERDLSRTPLFQVLFNMLNLPRGEIQVGDLTLSLLAGPESVPSKFDLTFYVSERGASGGPIDIDLVYNADLFDEARMVDFAAQYESLLTQAVAAPTAPMVPLSELSLVTEWARAVLPDPRAALGTAWVGSVHELFAAQARRAPGRLAVSDREGSWTYGELDKASGRLAAWLLEQGVAREARVAVWAHRSAPLVPAVLAALRAGAAFTMLDPAYPAARLVDMLTLAAPRACLLVAAAGPVPAEVAEWLAEAGCPSLVLPGGGPGGLLGMADLPAATRSVDVGPEHLAYVAFTSGSTGTPKGILGRHGPLTHFLPWMIGRFGLSEDDRFTMLSGLAHDPLQRDLFTPLCLGAAIVVPDPEEMPVPGRAAAWLARTGATVAHLTPAMGQLLTEPAAGEEPAVASSLRLALLVGEALTRQDVARLRRLAPWVTCVNLFGSTETQRAVGYHVATEDEASGGGGHQVLALGRGMEDIQLLVLNRAGALTGIGEVGEISVRSPHLSRGYLRDPVLTAARFGPAPAGDRLYRTGDLGRYLPDGEVTFAGRGDAQLKIRGFRVEPAEIEAALTRHPAVAAAAALLHDPRGERGERFLVALVVPAPGEEPSPSELREHLLGELPAHMVPAAFARVAALPRTPNGKLDRRALARLVPTLSEMVGDASLEAFTAPRDPTEALLAEIWAGLLGLDRVGIHDNFFALGGHSLLATRLLSRVREALGVELPVRALFETPTVAGLAAVIATSGGEVSGGPPPLRRVAREGALPLSFAQERLWVLDRLAPGESAYNIHAAVRFTGPLDPAAFGAALDEVVCRHETLRTLFHEDAEGEPVQVVAPWSPVGCPVVDLSALPAGEREAAVRRLAAEEADRPFDLEAGQPLRACLLKVDREGHVILLTVHHIAADGWSIGLLVDELGALYGAARAGQPLSDVLAELPVQYGDYAVWQRGWLSGAALDAQMAYWRRALDGAPALELPTDRPRPAVRSPRGTRRPAVLTPGLSEDLRRLGRAQGATPFMVLLAGFDALLGRLSGQDDVSVGSPIANRTRREVEGLIGFFANTLVLRADLSGDPGFLTLLERTREATLAAYAHQDLPFEKLVGELAPVRDLGRTPLFQVMFVLQNAATPAPGGRDRAPSFSEEARNWRHQAPSAAGTPSDFERPPERTTAPGRGGFAGLAAERLTVAGETSKFDLTLSLGEDDGGAFAGAVESSTDLFDGATIERMLGQFRALLAGTVAEPTARLSDLPLLTAPERQALLEWNATAARLPGGDRCLHDLVWEQAERTPDAVAVTFEGNALTYAELAARSLRLAHHLRRLGVGPDVAVGVCLERSLELIVALLGVLEAGGAYLPLDPSYPRERLLFMLEDGLPPVVLAAADTAALLPPHPGRTVFLDEQPAVDALPAGPDRSEQARATPENLAYVIFTSGSTGRPKGVMMRHRSIVNRVLWNLTEFPFTSADRLLQKTPFSFDASIWEIFAPLWRGGVLVVARPGGHQDTAYMAAALATEAITVLQLVPSLLRVLLDEPALGAAAGVRLVFCGGEALAGDLVERCHALLPATVTNFYGPTEVAIDATFRRCERGAVPVAIPIGRPIANDRVDLVTPWGALSPIGAPIGVAGELRVGGVGLARGYVGRPDLTAERFVPDPAAGSAAEPGARLYRTGDLARRTADGAIEYLGRLDHQVKIRGFRIELGEIEAALTADPAVAEAVVVARNLQLVAYLVPRGEGPALPELRAALTARLPYYMLPATFVVLPALPRTPNGKLDRRALPAPDITSAGREAAYEAPRPGIEERLAAVWAEVLGERAAAHTQGIGRHDNFFALGGDSLLALRIVHKAREAGIAFTPLQLFERQTIAELVDLLGLEQVPDAPAAAVPAEALDPGAPDTSGADFDSDDLARFLASLTGG